MARLKGSKDRLVEDTQVEASNCREVTSNSQSSNQNEILEHLLLALVAM